MSSFHGQSSGVSCEGGGLGDEAPCQDQQGGVKRKAQGGHQHDSVAAGLELAADVAVGGLGGEELAMALVAAVDGGEKDGGGVGGEEGADGIELVGEDFEDDEGKGELAEGGADVGALVGTLGGADFVELVGGENDGAGAVEAETQMLLRMWLCGGGRGSANPCMYVRMYST